MMKTMTMSTKRGHWMASWAQAPIFTLTVLATSTALALASSATSTLESKPNSAMNSNLLGPSSEGAITGSGASSSSSASSLSKQPMPVVERLDRLSGAQFVELVDPLMERQLSRIREQIRRRAAALNQQMPPADRVPARQYIRMLDMLSDNQVSALLHSYYPTVFPLWSDRPRRASLDTMSGLSLGYSKRSPLDAMSGVSFGAPSKRFGSINFDEMDRSGFSGFAKRRSDFDEMDHSGFSSFAKRFSDFDEIDRAGFSGFAKRRGGDFDEIDRAGFSSFAKRGGIDFDEIDRSGFSGFAKRKRSVSNPVVNLINRQMDQVNSTPN